MSLLKSRNQLSQTQNSSGLLVSSKDYFAEMVDWGLEKKKAKYPSPIRDYLVNLLEHYLYTHHLYENEIDEMGQRKKTTLAEMYLEAGQMNSAERIEHLKKMADRSLYISGFFGDSLSRSLVDVDYYANMGGAAYGLISQSTPDEDVSQLYRVFSMRFLDFVDVLSFISQKSQVQNDKNILRLYDHYMKTGSEAAREQLSEQGVIPMQRHHLKKSK